MIGYVRFETVKGGEYLVESRQLDMEVIPASGDTMYLVCGKIVTPTTYRKLLEKMEEAGRLVCDLVGEGSDAWKETAKVQ